MGSLFRRFGLVALSLVLVPAFFQSGLASSSGNLRGLIQDQSGHPLSHVLITLLRGSSEHALPILALSDGRGRIHLADIEVGDYEISIKSSRFQRPSRRRIEVLPGKTTAVRLVLQQLFQLGNFQEDNLRIKTLLRNAPDERLIFRTRPGQSAELSAERPADLFADDVVLEVFNSAGLGDDYLIVPGKGAGGTASNFAMVQSLSGGAKIILAGQRYSGADPLWRLKNFIQVPLSDRHSLEGFAGYERVSFNQPLATHSNHSISRENASYFSNTPSPKRVMSIGFKERVLVNNTLSVLWGLEINQVDTDGSQIFLNPNAEVQYAPTDRTQVRVLIASKRSTYAGSLELPSGEVVNLRDGVDFFSVGDQFKAGSSRHYRGSITQQVTDNTRIEFAAYNDHLSEGASSFVAVSQHNPVGEFLNLNGPPGEVRGYRLMVRRRLSPTLTTSVAYVRGSAMGIDDPLLGPLSQGLNLAGSLETRSYHGVSTQIEAYLPFSQTHVNALVKFVPGGNPITTLDAFTDRYETGNEGINLFVRQVVPMPEDWLNFLGLDFMVQSRIEALLDIRNLTNEDLGGIHTDVGKVLLVRSPRTVRGGISVKF
ncbi:MAG: carboxypeptidase-like regulatory domain-containing protein [Acidobacteriota bacterium]